MLSKCLVLALPILLGACEVNKTVRENETVTGRILGAEEIAAFDPSGALYGGAIGGLAGSALGKGYGMPGFAIGYAMGGSSRKCELPVEVEGEVQVLRVPQWICREVELGSTVELSKHTITVLTPAADSTISVTVTYDWKY